MAPESWLQALRAVPDGAIYGLLFAAAVVENLFPPAPGDLVTVFGGYLAGSGRVALPPTYLAVSAGNWAGFMVVFLAGRLLGRSSLHRLLVRWASQARVERAERWVGTYGSWVVLANRFLPGVRSVISLTAGFAGLPARQVGLLALASSLAWNVLLVGAGYTLGDEWERVVRLLATYDKVALGVLAGLAVLWLFWRWRRPVR